MKLYAFIRSFLFPCLKSSPFLSLYSILAPMFGLMPTLIPTSLLVFILTLVFCPESFAVLLFCYVPNPAISAAFSLPCHTFVFCYGILALLLPLFMLSLLLFLGFLTLKILKWFLSNEPWPCMLTSPAKPLYQFLALGVYNSDNNNGLYNLTNNNKRKRSFDTTFINSCLLAGNHDQKELDLSKCSNVVKLN